MRRLLLLAIVGSTLALPFTPGAEAFQERLVAAGVVTGQGPAGCIWVGLAQVTVDFRNRDGLVAVEAAPACAALPLPFVTAYPAGSCRGLDTTRVECRVSGNCAQSCMILEPDGRFTYCPSGCTPVFAGFVRRA